MQYQDFLQIAGTSAGNLSEADYSNLIEPVILDRRDLFPTDEAAMSHYNLFGLDGFSDEFLSTLDQLIDCLTRAKRITGIAPHAFHKLVEIALEQA